jgi:hypothetical protein
MIERRVNEVWTLREVDSSERRVNEVWALR